MQQTSPSLDRWMLRGTSACHRQRSMVWNTATRMPVCSDRGLISGLTQAVCVHSLPWAEGFADNCMLWYLHCQHNDSWGTAAHSICITHLMLFKRDMFCLGHGLKATSATETRARCGLELLLCRNGPMAQLCPATTASICQQQLSASMQASTTSQ
jgi:hypothetical protein